MAEARVIPLHPDDGPGGRRRWRLGPGAPGPGARRPRPEVPEPTPEPEPPGWEAALEEALAFLRRRLTGEYTIDEFGFDADLTDNVLLPALRPLYRIVVPGGDDRHAPRARDAAGRSSSPTTPGRSRSTR